MSIDRSRETHFDSKKKKFKPVLIRRYDAWRAGTIELGGVFGSVREYAEFRLANVEFKYGDYEGTGAHDWSMDVALAIQKKLMSGKKLPPTGEKFYSYVNRAVFTKAIKLSDKLKDLRVKKLPLEKFVTERTGETNATGNVSTSGNEQNPAIYNLMSETVDRHVRARRQRQDVQMSEEMRLYFARRNVMAMFRIGGITDVRQGDFFILLHLEMSKSYEEVTAMFNEQFGVSLSVDAVRKRVQRLRDRINAPRKAKEQEQLERVRTLSSGKWGLRARVPGQPVTAPTPMAVAPASKAIGKVVVIPPVKVAKEP